ncbi:MAG: ABC transporter permease [Desulfobacterales bacterium]
MRPRCVHAVARKEMIHLLRDPRSLALAFLIPLLLLFLFGSALRLDVEELPAAVVDRDRSPESRDLIRRIHASRAFAVREELETEAELARALDGGRVLAGWVVPAGWGAARRSGRPAPVQVLIDGSDPNTGAQARSFASALLERVNPAGGGGLRGGDPPAVEARLRVWFNENLESRTFIVPGILAVILMIAGALLASTAVAREAESGTLETLRMLPLSAAELAAGKALPYVAVAWVDVLAAAALAAGVFGIAPRAGIPGLLLASFLYILVAVGTGLWLSAIARSQLVATQLAILATYLPSLLLSDFVFPRQNMPVALQALSALVPATYFIDVLNGLYLRGIPAAGLWPSLLVLFGMAAALAAGCVWALRREGF